MYCNKANLQVFGLALEAVNTASIQQVSITDTTYTRIQGGYDAKTSSGWTVGGQVSYLRGNDDYVFNGTGKEKAFAVGAYGLKDLGNNQYIHIESQVGRASNDFTVRNEIGEACLARLKLMHTLSVHAMVKL